MKLKSFRIQNYKSIVDSGSCRLSDNDLITVLAGQNESGKSSILQALKDFGRGEIHPDSIRDDESKPMIWCTFSGLAEDLKSTDLFELAEIKSVPEDLKMIFDGMDEVTFCQTNGDKGEPLLTFEGELNAKISLVLEIENQLRAETKSDEELESESDEWDITETIDELIVAIISLMPTFIFFDDFCDLLPEQIFIKDLIEKNKTVKGYQAVKNIEKILSTDFSKIPDLSDPRREKRILDYHESITAQFNEKWKQKISEGNGANLHVKFNRDKSGVPYLKFYIETKKSEFLPLEKRSQGFKWFLSFFLQLKAEGQGSKNLIILFDEPGLYLHSKAQLDMINVFEELSHKNQIIYSTHSPYLVDTTKLHRVRLILNTKEAGTTIEKITSSRSVNQKDALKPIIDALGLEVCSPFTIGKKDNIITEGISDFHYLQGMKKLLDIEHDFGIIPSMGASNCHLLMELCIGWGLNWMILFDDKGSSKEFKKIKKSFFEDNDQAAGKKIMRLSDCDGIEDCFTVGDMKLIVSGGMFSADQKNSQTVGQNGGKELVARLFYEGVLNGEITKGKLSQTAIRRFTEIFQFAETAVQ